MEIIPGLEIVDLTLKYKDTLILGDLQLGYEQSLNNRGFLLPSFNLNAIIERLEKIFAKVKVKRVVVNGDVKHEFGKILRKEWKETTELFEWMLKRVKEIIIVKGNHDVILGPIAEKMNIQLVEYYQIDDLTILHGHKIIAKMTKIIIVGHEHPAVSFPEKPYEKFKCFLKGEWNGHILIVMPSFNFVSEGTDITKSEFLGPFLKDRNIDSFEVFVVDDKVYRFGKVEDITTLEK